MLDLTQVPFSRAGAYFALSLRDAADTPSWKQTSGGALFFRTLHGDREADRVFRLEPLLPNGAAWEPAPFRVEAVPHLLRLYCDTGLIEICLSAPDAMRVRGTGAVGLRLTLANVGGYGNAQPYDRDGRWLVNAWTARMNYLLSPLVGRLTMDAPTGVMRAEQVRADFLPDEGADGFEALVEEFLTERVPTRPAADFDAAAQEVAAAFAAFCADRPSAPESLQTAASLMDYVMWSALVAPQGHFQRPAMLMSKNHMANVWSWDHCFNALALTPHAPALAWDQFLTPFDHQDAAGALPDCVNDKSIVRNFTKPPIHGWTLRGMLERDRQGYLTNARLGAVYEPLARWTRWWLQFRDQDSDGVPHYNHGNDSGWDNSTAFDVGFPLEGPDLSAYLILQMDTLADLARRLDRPDEAQIWTQEADALLARLMAHSWRGDRFIAPHSGDHRFVASEAGDSLFLFLPLALGTRLPEIARQPLVAGLLAEGRFLTEFGLATESVASPRYEADGYWRGPVWAPPILLIADGLRRLGETDAARTIAERFCRAVAQSGSAENFDAQTGAGLRDRAYTWTASVFLILAEEFLSAPQSSENETV